MKKLVVLTVTALSLLAFAAPSAVAADDNWMMRGRVINIAPSADADGGFEGSGLDVDSQFTFEVDFTRFFGKHLGLEVSLATASHDVTVSETEVNAPAASDVSLGSVDLLPPSFMLQWHFLPDGKIKPYLGAGLNYTTFYNVTGFLQDLDFDDSISYAAQAGLDWKVGEEAYFNFDVKYIAMETDVSFDGEKIGTVTIDPLVIGVGLGFKF